MATGYDSTSESSEVEKIDLSIISTPYNCPVCYNLARPPIRTCVEGHIICSDCLNKLGRSCPVCRSPLGTGRNLVLNQYTAHFTYPCIFAYEGCNNTGKLIEIKQHEKVCPYRPCKCPFYKFECNWEGELEKLVPHIQSKHREIPYMTVHKFDSSITHTEPPLPSMWVFLMKCYQCYFFITILKRKLDNNLQYDFIAQLIGQERFCNNFRYIISFKQNFNNNLFVYKEAFVSGIQITFDQVVETKSGIVLDGREVLQFETVGTLEFKIHIKKC